ncbi:MAG: WecB/TagA/CpsF family glycosyltransferase [Desulfobacterales bacterium]
MIAAKKMNENQLEFCNVYGVKLSKVDKVQALRQIVQWGFEKKSKYVIFCNSHTVYEINKNNKIKKAINEADLVLPDGFSVMIGSKLNGFPQARRIAGPDMMMQVCRKASENSQKIFLYGANKQTLEKIQKILKKKFQNIKIAGAIAPPYRELTEEEADSHRNIIQKVKPHYVFVGLGFPKQELWMTQNRGRVEAVMMGVGAAFDFLSENKKRAPKLMQNIGLEWFWRFLQEPKRLGPRYLHANSYIMKRLLRDLINRR